MGKPIGLVLERLTVPDLGEPYNVVVGLLERFCLMRW